MSNRPKYTDIDPQDWPAISQYTWIEKKYDGHYVELIGGLDGWILRGRTGTIYARGDDPLPECHLLGEHIIGTEWACAPRQADIHGSIVVFDAADQPDHDDLLGLICEIQACGVAGLALTMSRRYPIDRARSLWAELVEGGDWEGLIFRHRGRLVGRMKKQVTRDYVCMDIPYSDAAKYAAWGARAVIGGLMIDGELVEHISVGGLTDGQRREFLSDRDNLIGRVFEVRGNGHTGAGALRHPRFSRWRDDKNAADCL